MQVPFSAFPEIRWPAVPTPYAARLLAVLFQLERSQWLSPAELATQQFGQLRQVLEHAYETVPHYRQHFDALNLRPSNAPLPELWPRFPLLSRRDIQAAGDRLHSTRVPRTHGQIGTSLTSGSTGQPVLTRTTELTRFFWQAFTLREHLWHRREFGHSMAAIRHVDQGQALPPHGMREQNWGEATKVLMPTGPAFLLNVHSTLGQQANWLRKTNPTYLLSYPSVLLELARLFEAENWQLPALQGIRTFGEIVEPHCRALCSRVFGVPVVDLYSSQEVGYIAFQCPNHGLYHVQSENLLVEVLNEAGVPCVPGEVGKIVITTLHNFAMPLLRYDIGDYAEVGEPCSCGRGLPTLRRILGRQRNLLVLPNGERRWPGYGDGDGPEELAPCHQFQMVQLSRQEVRVNMVRPREYTAAEEEQFKRYFQQTLGYPFDIMLNYVPEIPRSATGKFEDFISFAS